MRIAITSSVRLPVKYYGGAERVIWDLCDELNKLGHEIKLLAPKGSRCDFAECIEFHNDPSFFDSVSDIVDIIHFFSLVPKNIDCPHIYTLEGNATYGEKLPQQTVFISKDQAYRHSGDCFVYNCLNNPQDFNISSRRDKFHFLGKAAWKKKNVLGAIKCARKANSGKIDILGGNRLNFNMGFRFTLDPIARFHGKVDNAKKYKIMETSKGLVFPVRWNEPFGLAIIESLFSGCPVFGSPYGSLAELVPPEVGFLSANSDELAEAMKDSANWKPQNCRDYAMEHFNSNKMALCYLEIYERVIGGEVLNRNNPTLQKPEPKLLPFE